MPDLAVALLLAVVFIVCGWSGRTLAHHYQDRLESVAILAIGACVLAGLALAHGVGGDDASAWPKAALALASSGGLFTGYMRGGARFALPLSPAPMPVPAPAASPPPAPPAAGG